MGKATPVVKCTKTVGHCGLVGAMVHSSRIAFMLLFDKKCLPGGLTLIVMFLIPMKAVRTKISTTEGLLSQALGEEDCFSFIFFRTNWVI